MGFLARNEQLDRIERQLAELTRRVWALEKQVGQSPQGASSVIAPQTFQKSEVKSPPIEERVFTPTPPATESRTSFQEETPVRKALSSGIPPLSDFHATTEPAHKRTRMEWETLVGGKWALWVGSIAVFLAIAFFLAYTWDSFSPARRVTIGYLSGFLFLLSGIYSRKRMERWFYQGLLGVGLAISYLTTWSGTAFYHLLSPQLAFAIMGMVTVFGVALSVFYNAISLITLSTLGGFLTPILLQSGGHTLPLLNYITLLNLGILAVSLFKRWKAVVWLSFIATILLVAGRASQSWLETERMLYFNFSTMYFLLFLASSCFYNLTHKEETKPEDLSLFFVDTLVYAVVGHSLIQPLLGKYPGIFPIALFAFFVLVTVAVHTFTSKNAVLKLSALGLSILFLTISIPIQLHQRWITLALSMEAAILCTLGVYFRSAFFRTSGGLVWLVSVVSLLNTLFRTEPQLHFLFVNERALPLLVSFISTAWIAIWGHLHRQETEDSFSSFYGGFAVLAGGWLLAQETSLGFQWKESFWPQTWQANAMFMTACFLALYSAIVFKIGLTLRYLAVRASALSLGIVAAILPILASEMLGHAHWTPFFNLRFFAFAAVAAALAANMFIFKTSEGLPNSYSLNIPLIGAITLGLWGITQETYETFYYYQDALGEHWDRAAQMSVSLVWTLCGTLLLIGGIVRHHQPVRFFSLGLFSLTILKVFFFDLSFLDTPYRILSFGGLGAALIGISWLYSRYGKGIEGG